MFPLTALGHFYFDARLLSVQSIDDTQYESSDDSEPDTAKCECERCAASNDEACNRDLVWCDSRFAKTRDDCVFDRCMNVSRQVECSILRGIENDALCETTVLCPRRRKTEWPHMPAHADDIIIFLRRVDDIDLRVIDLLREFV